MNRRLPLRCPSCDSRLTVKSMGCDACDASVNGSFNLPVLASLSSDDQEFLLAFIKSSGSLKNMSQQLKLSYPTVRNMLNEIINRITLVEQNNQL